MAELSTVIRRGTRASQPTPASNQVGILYCVTDEGDVVERWSGTAWQSYSPDAGLTELTGHVTTSGTGSVEATLATNHRTSVLTFTFDGGGAAIAVGSKLYTAPSPYAGVITDWHLISNDDDATAGDIQIDVWKMSINSSPGGFPPGNSQSITNSNEPALAASPDVNYATDDVSVSPSPWSDTAVAVGDVFGAHVDSNGGGLTRVTLQLTVVLD